MNKKFVYQVGNNEKVNFNTFWTTRTTRFKHTVFVSLYTPYR